MAETSTNVKQISDFPSSKPMTNADIQTASVRIETLASKAAAIRTKAKPAIDAAQAQVKAAQDALAASKSALVAAQSSTNEAVQYEKEANALRQSISGAIAAQLQAKQDEIKSLRALVTLSKGAAKLVDSASATGQRHRFCQNGNCTKCKSGDVNPEYSHLY